MQVNYSNTYCESFQSRKLGCFANVTQTVPYGDTYPSVPAGCCSSIYGPPPGQLVESGVPKWEECNTFGGFDPNEPFAIGAFRTCSGHGIWNDTTYRCQCDGEWNAVQVGSDSISGEDVYSCKRCFGFFGPQPPLDSPPEETTVAFCSILMTPNEEGISSECGGHGAYIDDTCSCYSSLEQGYWSLTQVSQTFERVLASGERTNELVLIETCSSCYDNMSLPENGCPLSIVEEPPLFILEQATNVPVIACQYCTSYGKTVITGVQFIDMSSNTLSSTTCCTVTFATFTEEVRVTNGTCVETEEGRRHVASLTCQYLSDCIAYTIHKEPLYWTFKFTTQKSFLLVYSLLSESGAACPATSSPVPPTTPFPTANT